MLINVFTDHEKGTMHSWPSCQSDQSIAKKKLGRVEWCLPVTATACGALGDSDRVWPVVRTRLSLSMARLSQVWGQQWGPGAGQDLVVVKESGNARGWQQSNENWPP